MNGRPGMGKPAQKGAESPQRQFLKHSGLKEFPSGDRIECGKGPKRGEGGLPPGAKPCQIPLSDWRVSSRAKASESDSSPESRIEPVASLVCLNCLRWLQTGAFIENQAYGSTTMILAHGRLKIGGGQMLRMRLMGTPFHEPAVADPAQQTRHEHCRRAANSAAVVIVRDVQPLMQAIFDAAKASPVKFQPLLRVEFAGLGAGQQTDLFILATFIVAEQLGRLGHQRKANLLSRDWLGTNRAAHQVALFVIQGAELSGRRFPRGENPPWGREPVGRCFDGRWAGCPWPSAGSRRRLPARCCEPFRFACAGRPARRTDL